MGNWTLETCRYFSFLKCEEVKSINYSSDISIYAWKVSKIYQCKFESQVKEVIKHWHRMSSLRLSYETDSFLPHGCWTYDFILCGPKVHCLFSVCSFLTEVQPWVKVYLSRGVLESLFPTRTWLWMQGAYIFISMLFLWIIFIE